MLPRRQRRLSLTPAGEDILLELRPGVDVMYQGMMNELTPAEQKEFMRLLRKFVHLHDNQGKPAARKTAQAHKA